MKTEEFAERNLLFKVPFLIGALHIQLYTMFAGFASLDANMIACGLGFRPETKNEPQTYNAKKNVNMFSFQFSTNGTDALANFNIQVNSWLKYYVMIRTMDRVRPKGAV